MLAANMANPFPRSAKGRGFAYLLLFVELVLVLLLFWSQMTVLIAAHHSWGVVACNLTRDTLVKSIQDFTELWVLGDLGAQMNGIVAQLDGLEKPKSVQAKLHSYTPSFDTPGDIHTSAPTTPASSSAWMDNILMEAFPGKFVPQTPRAYTRGRRCPVPALFHGPGPTDTRKYDLAVPGYDPWRVQRSNRTLEKPYKSSYAILGGIQPYTFSGLCVTRNAIIKVLQLGFDRERHTVSLKEA
ncbi:hypothetical protein Dda_6410 [Drechslerella dactyloides]|uniref:Uncharacterized protein n=1 Tax=Drechslerella dactyloides TaxID=74499 RepID=A0AAD6NHD8_DREDA|nr:hypothetical protein Dda_6410 [Drechslerella dactyloides]